jgi:N-acetylmuramoyl-L-alanine amidase
MKKIIYLVLVLLTSVAVHAEDLTGIKIYVNPGHGGHDPANDRNIVTIPFEAGDPNGYWESNSNLVKGLTLCDLLETAGATVVTSRTLNREEDDRALSAIVAEANANNVDAFLSIHSNAGGALTNYSLMLYAGVDPTDTWTYPTPTPYSNEGRALSVFIGNNIISNQLTVWSSSAPSIRGDKTFGRTAMAPSWSDGYGVLRGLTVPGLISEGEFHEYKPEAHRLLNNDYCALEAHQFYRSFCSYFDKPQAATGIIAGYVKSGNENINHPRYAYIANSQDQWLPLNGATVKLFDATGQTELGAYTTDDFYNGVFAFYNLTPGDYKLRLSAPQHETKTVDITVTAAQTAYAKIQLKNIRMAVSDYPDPEQGGGVLPLTNYDFETIGGITDPGWLNSNDIKRILYRKGQWYVLTSEPKILIVNASTSELIKELDLTGAENLSDIAFTADNFLLACNKETIPLESPTTYWKVYTWDDDDSAPRLLFQTQKQANWANGVVGETFTVSGARWNCTLYTTALSTSPSAWRIIGLKYNEDTAEITTKYMLDAENYTTALWGDHPVFTISPNGEGDHLYITGKMVTPLEYQFDWNKPDRDPMIQTGQLQLIQETEYVPDGRIAGGGSFFRHARHTYLVTAVSRSDASHAGLMLFDVTDGLNNAVKVSAQYPSEGLGETPAAYMTATGVVNGYDIELTVLAKGQGMVRYKTVEIPVANIYASGLSVTSDKTFRFTLNEDAERVSISILKEGETVMSHDAGALQKGAHLIPNPFQDTEFDAWSVSATAHSVSRPIKISGSGAQFQFFSLRGIAVDNNPESPFFGRIYASEGNAGAAEGRSTQDGIYVLNALFEDATDQGATAYNGGVSWHVTSAASPFRLKVSPDGDVYITDWSDSPTSGVWKMNPAQPGNAFKPIFGGTVNSTGVASENGTNIHGSISDCWITGTGNHTQLYTFDEDLGAVSGVTGNIYRYDVGTSDSPWTDAPSALIYDDAVNGNIQLNGNSSIAPDGAGGWWISQYRSSGNDGTAVPSLIHAQTNTAGGTVDFNSGRFPGLIGASEQGGMAVTADGSRIAVGMNNNIKIYDIAFDANGVPTLTQTYTIEHGGGATYSLAFDVADNLYAALNKTLSVWAIPKMNNSYTTRVATTPGTGIPAIQSVNVNVYPNPVTSELFIDGQGIKPEAYTLYDLNGRAIRSETINGHKQTVSVTGLNAGVYILQIQTGNGIIVKRIIKK